MIALVWTVAAYPVYSPGVGDSVDSCDQVKCADLECKPPFHYKAPADAGTCCPVCWSDEIKVPEDRSWAEGLSGGIGADPNADQTLCRGVVCPKPDCPENEQVFSGRCCTTCEHNNALSSATDARDAIDAKNEAPAFLQVKQDPAPEDALAKEMTHDLEMNFNKIAPFGKEDTAKELQDHAAKTQDTLVDAVENAEVAEIKRAVFRALTRLRAATIKEFDTIARLETQAIDAYNDAHHYRAENPLSHLHEDEAPVETDKLKSFH